MNIVKLYGVCYENSILKYLVMEYMNMGDLHSFLVKSRTNKVDYIYIIYKFKNIINRLIHFYILYFYYN